MAGVIHQIAQQRQQDRRIPIFRIRFEPILNYDDVDIYQRYRFTPQNINRIVEELRPDLEFGYRRRGCLSPENQVLLTLRFYATGSFQNLLGDSIMVHKSTVSRCIHRVSAALCRRARNHIHLPHQEEANLQKRAFNNMGHHPGLPNVVGVVDGTQIKIQAPTQNEHEYVNRKGEHAINVQIVCDADLRVINCVVKQPGSVHDSRMLRESSIWRAFEEQPPILDGLILGDSAYPLRDWLLTPILNPQTAQERRYNDAFRSTRSIVERCIGVLKRRFHCLHSELRYAPERACKIITACIVLHNMAVEFGTPFEEAPLDDDDHGDEECDMQPTRGGRALREAIVRRF